ncbi:CRISPR-associated protein Cas4 [archaeon]|jgi:CRISPR-associated protein Cas4|nr:CRISPR-associated protein Cas4 [archaeon]MBT3730936.1 CRISPR-associated protein Cas4 [archaeon]MBT4669825.1 CRISPR-associated protein Cas4 [archaeon]MBT5029976.1 CRISPR-associated protein Cas4 [archaeon]MBT5288078.1 CRISPR-associated protein Cas4 [archaeon]
MIAVTDLTSFMYCPRKLYFRKVLKIKEDIQELPVKGIIKHKVYELVVRKDREIIASLTEKESLEDFEMKFRRNYYQTILLVLRMYKKNLKELELKGLEVYQEIWPFFLDEAKARSKEIYDFAKENNIYGEALWMKLPKGLPEIRVSSEALGMRGIVDQVNVDEGFIPIEIKTGKAPKDGVWKEHKIQVGAYMMLLSEHYGTEIKEGYVEYRMANEKRKVVMNEFLREDILDLIERVNELLKSDSKPERVKVEWKCENCGIREKCYSAE